MTNMAEQTTLELDIAPEKQGLSEDDQKQLAGILQKHTRIPAAISGFYNGWQEVMGKFRTLVSVLVEENLAPRELTLVLLGAGFSKSRASEIKRLVESAPEVRDAYLSGLVGFRAAYQLAAESDPVAPALVMVPGALQLAIAEVVNGYNGAMPKNKAVLKVERLDWVWTITLRKKRAAKAKETPSKGKSGKGNGKAKVKGGA